MVVGGFHAVGVASGFIEVEADSVLLVDADGPLPPRSPPSLCSLFPGGFASSSTLSTRSSCASFTCARLRVRSETARDLRPSKSLCVSLSLKLLIKRRLLCHATHDTSRARLLAVRDRLGFSLPLYTVDHLLCIRGNAVKIAGGVCVGADNYRLAFDISQHDQAVLTTRWKIHAAKLASVGER